MARRRGGKKIDFVHWTGLTGLIAAQGAGFIGLTIGAAQHLSETLLRLRGEFLCYLDGTQTPGARVLIQAGIILVPEGTGTTVLWDPFSDADAPWIWYEGFTLGYEEGVTDVIGVQVAMAKRITVDNKAMRIIRNQEMQLVVANSTLGTASSVDSSLVLRGLFGT